MTTTVLNTKISETEHKIPYVTDLVKKKDYDANIKDIEKKHFTTVDYDTFTSETLMQI